MLRHERRKLVRDFLAPVAVVDGLEQEIRALKATLRKGRAHWEAAHQEAIRATESNKALRSGHAVQCARLEQEISELRSLLRIAQEGNSHLLPASQSLQKHIIDQLAIVERDRIPLSQLRNVINDGFNKYHAYAGMVDGFPVAREQTETV
jgi:chromosome segregation ATPase